MSPSRSRFGAQGGFGELGDQAVGARASRNSPVALHTLPSSTVPTSDGVPSFTLVIDASVNVSRATGVLEGFSLAFPSRILVLFGMLTLLLLSGARW